MAQTTLISSIERSVYYPTEYILSSPYRCGTFSLIVDTGTWTEQMYYELPYLQLDIYTTVSGVDVKYLSCNITLDTDNPNEPYTISLYELPETFKVRLTPGFDSSALESHKDLCSQLNIPSTWTTETNIFNCQLIWGDDNIKSGAGSTVDEVARSTIATHTSQTDNPHIVTKSQVGLSNVVNTDTTTTSNITDSTNKRFITDMQKTVLENTSGANTGDENTASIKSKLGVSSTATDGYLTKEDFIIFNNKANTEDFAPLSHVTDNTNPHAVTKAQVGLSNVDNTSDLDKPISSLTQTALDLKADGTIVTAHNTNTSNPHNVTKTQIGLDNVANMDTTTTSNITDSTDKRFITDAQKTVLENTSGNNTGDETNTTIISKIGYTPENALNKGVNNGYCGLDSGGKVPLQNLPSTLLKYIGTWNASTNTPSLTATDLTKVSHVYVVSHSGTQFGITWKAGDWLIYDADGMAEKSDNSDDVVSVNGKTGIVVINKADVGLSNVDNTSDIDKPISTLTQTALNSKADGTIVSAHTTNTNNPHSVTKTQVGLGNVLNIDTSVTTNITDTSLKRFVSDTEKTTWNSKRDTLPEITQRTTTSEEWRSIAYGNGIFIAVAAAGTNRVMRSVDGVTWTPVVVIPNTWYSVAYGNGVFVAVASVGTNRVMRSADGITWTPVVVSEGSWWSIAYGNGMFVAVASYGTNRVMRSIDGITWTTTTVVANEWRGIAYGNGVFVAVAISGTNRVMRSIDGITWTTTTVVANEWRGITYGNGIFVAVASYGTNRVMRSIDGITWTTTTVVANEWRGITYGNGIFVAVAATGTNRVMYSVDAVNWYYKNIPLMGWQTIGYGDGMFVALALNSSSGLLTIGNRTYSDKSRVVKKSVIGEVSVTILPTDWTGSTAPFEKTIAITISGEQITNTTHDIKVSLVLSSDINIARQEQEAYSYFSKGEISATNVLKITCFDYKPSVTLNIMLEVIKKW